MSTLKKFKENLSKSKIESSPATFNAKPKGLKKLGAISNVEKIEIEKEPEYMSYEKLVINFPVYNTIKPIVYVDLSENLKSTVSSPRKAVKISTDNSMAFKIDTNRNVLIIGNGLKEYNLDTLSSVSSRAGTLNKNEIIELANTYLKLNIKVQNKKEVFIKEIRNKIGLPPE